MKNYANRLIASIVLVLAFATLAAFGQSPTPTPTNSAGSSASSGTRAGECRRLVNSCAAAVEDLAATRVLVEELERENRLLKERLETEKKATALLLELNETRKSEADALRAAIAAKNETIAAKDAAIAKQDQLIAELKKKKSSPWKRVGDVLIGIAAGVLLR